MKKIILSLAALSSLFSATDAQIREFYLTNLESQYPDIKINIKDRAKLANTGFESVIVEFEVNGVKQENIVFTKDNLITNELIDIESKSSYRRDLEMKIFEEARNNFEKNAKAAAQNEAMKIILGDKNKPVMFVFSDPECPFCLKHLNNVKNDLKTHQVHFILTPVHGHSAFEKSALIYKESKNAKNDDEKLAIMHKYFDPNIKDYAKVSDDEVRSVYETYEKYRSIGLRATPTIIK